MQSDNNKLSSGLLQVPVRDEAGRFSYLRIAENTHAPEQSLVRGRQKHRDIKEVTGYQLPVTSNAPAAHARHYIDVQDEEEVARFRSGALQARRHTASLLEAARELGHQALPDLELKERLARAITSFWQEVRTPAELREVLTRTSDLGGLALPTGAAEQVVQAATVEQEAIFKEFETAEPTQAPVPISRVEDILDLGQPQTSIMNQESRIKDNESSHETNRDVNYRLASQKSLEKKIPKVKFIIPEAGVQPLVTEVKTRAVRPAQTESIIKAVATRPTESSFVPSKPMGPVDELRTLSLTDFRRLGDSAQAATQKLYQKIDLLGDESIDMKSQGIKAWHGSPVYQAYLKSGQASIESHKSVQDVINENLMHDKDALSLTEFQAIADLNRSLAF